ncbi:MAG: molybdopterin-dependent oxidoreductase [Planctomycetaceae bacterium]|nr:molybdopterin-dependent oxidoreductase [Planctomycetaceae bacterium]MCA9045455.1 molybdopterin-dependent oxidoreductase [Planctomycetaceae bacterium]
MSKESFLAEHTALARRYFLQLGVAGLASLSSLTAWGDDAEAKPEPAGVRRDPYFTPNREFRDVSRGKPVPHSLSVEELAKNGMTRDTWRLEVLPDPDQPARLKNPLSIDEGTALDFEALLKLSEKHTVRFAKVMTCLNLGCPLGMGLWEGVPLREIIWQTQPSANLRRVFYHGFHNDDPEQMFRSSLPVGRVLEDLYGLPPVILCYKLNGEWLSSQRGGPVRMVVPEAYGFKSIKWLSHVYLSNVPTANDTYANQNNDVDSPLKTFAATLSVPHKVKPNTPIPVSGYAQVGVSGLSKVQVWIESQEAPYVGNEPHFADAPWMDADILPAPEKWTGLPGDAIPPGTHGFDETGRPLTWPLRLTNAHWAKLLPGLPLGQYTFRCRSVDENGIAQPLPRPFKKSGHAAIESVDFTVTEDAPAQS